MPSSRRLASPVAALGAVALLLAAQPAGGQVVIPDDRSFEVQIFRGPVGPKGFITLDSAEVLLHKQFGLSLLSSYQRGPFSIRIDSDRLDVPSKFDVVGDQMSSELAGAVGLMDRF